MVLKDLSWLRKKGCTAEVAGIQHIIANYEADNKSPTSAGVNVCPNLNVCPFLSTFPSSVLPPEGSTASLNILPRNKHLKMRV